MNALLAAIDAAVSAASLAFAIAGYRAIRRRQIPVHRRRMVIAAALSFAFLVVFAVRFATFGFATAPEGAVARAVYRIVLYSHEPLAVINVPLVAAALVLGLRRADRSHRKVAPMAFWIWMYVAVSGVALFVLLWCILPS